MPGPLADPERLRQPCPCGSGRRYKRCCHPRDLRIKALAEAAARAHVHIDRVITALVKEVEAQGRHTVACRAGCPACCHQYIRASEAEVARVTAWLEQPENEAVRRSFLDRFASWAVRAEGEHTRIDALADASTGRAEGPAWDTFIAAHKAWMARRLLCPFNEAGNCGIYPVRPAICRSVLVADTAEHCGPEATAPPALIRSSVLDRARARARAEMSEAEDQWHQSRTRRSLAHAVADQLARR